MRAWSVVFPRCEPAWITVNHCEQTCKPYCVAWGEVLRVEVCLSPINLGTHKRRVGHGSSLHGSHSFLLIPFAPSFLLYLCTTLWKIPLVQYVLEYIELTDLNLHAKLTARTHHDYLMAVIHARNTWKLCPIVFHGSTSVHLTDLPQILIMDFLCLLVYKCIWNS